MNTKTYQIGSQTVTQIGETSPQFLCTCSDVSHCQHTEEVQRRIREAELAEAEKASREAEKAHTLDADHWRGMFEMARDNMLFYAKMINSMLQEQQQFIKFTYQEQTQWIGKNDVVRAYTSSFNTFTIITRDLDNADSHPYSFNLDDPEVPRIQAWLSEHALDLDTRYGDK